MKKCKAILPLVLLALMTSIFLAASASADPLILTLANPKPNAPFGATESFTATVTDPLTNTGTIFLNSDSFNVDGGLTVDDSGYLGSFPLTMNPGDSFTGVLFTIDIPPGTSFLTPYNGFFEIVGGADGNASDVLATVNFSLNPIPEPSTFLSVGSGMLFFGASIRRRLKM